MGGVTPAPARRNNRKVGRPKITWKGTVLEKSMGKTCSELKAMSRRYSLIPLSSVKEENL